MGMGLIDSFPFSFGSFAILDDLTDCSSETVTYVERRRSSSSQDKAKSKSKQSTTTHARAHAQEQHVTSRHGSAAPGAGAVSAVKGPETARSTTVANLNVKEEDTRLRGAATNVSAKRSVANETIAKRSTVTAPAAPGREPSRRPKHEKREQEREQKASTKNEEVKQETKKEEINIEVITTSKGTVRSVSRSQTKSREPSHAPQPSEVETRPDVSSEELRKENRALRRRTERLEKDLAAYRRHAEHYRERRREADRERVKAEERVRELDTVVTNMRDSYELELENLRNQITEYAAKAAAMASATQLYAKDITGGTEEVRSVVASVKKTPSVHEFGVQTDPLPVPSPPPPRPSAPVPGAVPPGLGGPREANALLARLQLKDAELVALRFFHEETPQITMDQLTTSVRALNTELRSLALAMARNVRLSKSWEALQSFVLDAAEASLARCLRLLSDVKGADFSQDVTLVRLALQSWIVSCLQSIFEKFLFGLEKAEDDMLRRIFDRVQYREQPPVAARWRALTRRHARVLATPPISSPSTAGGGYAAARDHAIHLLEMDILVGAEAILRFSGAHIPQGMLLQELSREHGRRISRIVKRAAKLANDLAERAPVGCEVFIVHVDGDAGGEHSGMEMALCGCMESVDQECRQWVGQTARTERAGRTTGTRTRTHTRAGTIRRQSKTRSHAHTATTRTYADTNIRQWDRDSDEEYEDESEEDEEEIDEDEEKDQFVENVDADIRVEREGEIEVEAQDEVAHKHPTVLCSLGFGLRRVICRPRRRHATHPSGARIHAQPSQETLQRERRRVPKPEVETLHDSPSDGKSTKTFTLTSLAPTSPLTARGSRYRSRRAHELEAVGEGAEGAEGEAEGGREVEVLVKTDVLVSTTVNDLRKRVVQQ